MPIESVRQDVREYASSCGFLLADRLAPNEPSFSRDDLHIIEYDIAEMSKAFIQPVG
jgi:hypothetical protein